MFDFFYVFTCHREEEEERIRKEKEEQDAQEELSGDDSEFVVLFVCLFVVLLN